MSRVFVLGIAVAVCGAAVGADWRQFRGNDSDGVAEDAPAVAIDTVAWQAELPGRGLSGPIVVGDRVLVTASSGPDQDRLHVLCFEADSGRLRWERQFWATGRTMTHRKTCVAAPTPASDGQRVFAFFSSNDLACLDLEGNLLWYRGLGADYPNATNSLGMASSPLVVGDTLIVQMETDDDSLAAGLDTSTGLERWTIDRPAKANWTSALPYRGADGRTLALLQSGQGITAVDPATGEQVWSYTDGASTISSSVVDDGIVYAASHGITALRPAPGSKAFETLWREGRLGPSTISPLVYEDRLYTINGAAVLACADAETGKTQWQTRLQGPITASPVAAGGHLYVFNEKGLGQAVPTGPERGEVTVTQDLGETILATPAVADGALYVRSDGHLWKIGSRQLPVASCQLPVASKTLISGLTTDYWQLATLAPVGGVMGSL